MVIRIVIAIPVSIRGPWIIPGIVIAIIVSIAVIIIIQVTPAITVSHFHV